MKHYTGEILSHRKHGEEYHSLTIVAPDIAEAARPGQFVNLRPPADVGEYISPRWRADRTVHDDCGCLR